MYRASCDPRRMLTCSRYAGLAGLGTGPGTWGYVSHCHPPRPFPYGGINPRCDGLCWTACARPPIAATVVLDQGPPHRASLDVGRSLARSFQGSQGSQSHLGRLVTDCRDHKSNLPGLSPHVSRFLFLCTQSNQSIDCCTHRSLHRHIRIMPARKIECALRFHLPCAGSPSHHRIITAQEDGNGSRQSDVSPSTPYTSFFWGHAAPDSSLCTGVCDPRPSPSQRPGSGPWKCDGSVALAGTSPKLILTVQGRDDAPVAEETPHIKSLI